jgi:peptidoglycan-N-acetylglucosamine deacetylase
MNLGVIGALVAGAGAVAHGTFYRNSPIFGRPITSLPGRPALVSLTFDDGPNSDATPRVLDALGVANVHATFFVLGRHAERWPALVRRVVDEGHQLGNHGYYHRKLHRAGPAYVRDDLTRGTQCIEDACGVRPKLFRAPHGFRSPWVSAIAASLGQRTVGWSLGVWDSDLPGAEAIADRAVRGVHAGGILLLHDGDGYDAAGDRTQTAAALPALIAGIRARGLDFTLLPESR